MNRQQMVDAAADTLELARKVGMDNCSGDQPTLEYDHLVDMHRTMAQNVEIWSDGKMGRWLGWMQAAVCSGSMGDAGLEDFKDINRRHTD